MAKSLAPFNVNSSTFTQYVVQTSGCKRITIRETAKPGTVDYLVAFPTQNDGPYTVPLGEPYEHESGGAQFPVGAIPLFIKSVTGSVNFDAKED